jgi:putative N6-adenine-specific DNA methylase
MNEKGNTSFTEDKSFQRRLRRYVHAPVHRFAAVVPPELAPLCGKELEALGISGSEISEVGVEFSGKLAYCYLANLHLRTAGRVLCLFEPFRSGAPEELFRRANQIPWELWLSREIPLMVKAFVEHSRIEHEGLVTDTVLQAIQKRFRSLHLEAPSASASRQTDMPGERIHPAMEQRTHIHLRSDRALISLDTTGPHLHQRGYRLQHSGAPLRETLASAILLKSGWKGDTPLVDGMCGSGTIPIEAAWIARRLPPGLNRPFLFQQWPSYLDRTWAYLKKKALEGARDVPAAPVIAIDSDNRAISIARANAERAGVEKNIEWICNDFLEFKPCDRGLAPGLVVLNPPYGKRLHSDDRELYVRLGAHLLRYFPGWLTAVLLPDRSLAMHLRLGSMRTWNIMHGGLPITVAMVRVKGR